MLGAAFAAATYPVDGLRIVALSSNIRWRGGVHFHEQINWGNKYVSPQIVSAFSPRDARVGFRRTAKLSYKAVNAPLGAFTAFDSVQLRCEADPRAPTERSSWRRSARELRLRLQSIPAVATPWVMIAPAATPSAAAPSAAAPTPAAPATTTPSAAPAAPTTSAAAPPDLFGRGSLGRSRRGRSDSRRRRHAGERLIGLAGERNPRQNQCQKHCLDRSHEILLCLGRTIRVMRPPSLTSRKFETMDQRVARHQSLACTQSVYRPN